MPRAPSHTPRESDDHDAPETSPRVVWKGAISFGLVHVPIALHTATVAGGLDFDWLDRRTMDRVGYKRVNKKSGKEIAAEDIVKGLQVDDGRYVIVSPEEIAKAYPRTTQTIEIQAFVEAGAIPFLYLERPYYVAPIDKGAKVYALLREALLAAGKVGIARVVIQTRQHLAVLIPSGRAMVLNLLRWGDEIRPVDALDLPPAGARAAGITPAELAMARKLVEDQSVDWEPGQYRDAFKEQVLALVRRKAESGEIENVEAPPAPPAGSGGADIIDLTELLRQSLGKRPAKGEKATAADRPKPGPRKRAAARKPSSKRAA